MSPASHRRGAGTPPVGVLVMAYGSPASAGDVEAYYTHVRRGRPPTPELLADLERRYRAIGGTSPLVERTTAQADGVQAELDRRAPGRFRVFLGCKHSPPFLEDAVASMEGAGLRQVVGLVLAPHYSALSIGEYIERVRKAAASAPGDGMELAFVESWHLAPGLIELLVERLRTAVDEAARGAGVAVDGAARAGGPVEVLVTAHSLPSRILETGDPYPEQLRQTAEAVAAGAGVSRWRLAWQSAGRTPEPWLGPEILEVLRGLPGESPEVRAVVICPAGFVSDHLEVLYDVDVEARALAEGEGMVLTRTASLNDDPRLLATLADLVEERASALAGTPQA